MTENVSDTDEVDQAEEEFVTDLEVSEPFFGQYSVLSPGVQIVLDGRPVSAPALD